MIRFVKLNVSDRKKRRMMSYYCDTEKQFFMKHTITPNIRTDGRISIQINTKLFVDKKMTKQCTDFGIYRNSEFLTNIDDYKYDLNQRIDLGGENSGYSNINVVFFKDISIEEIKEIIKEIKHMLDNVQKQIIDSFMRVTLKYRGGMVEYSNDDAKKIYKMLNKKLNKITESN